MGEYQIFGDNEVDLKLDHRIVNDGDVNAKNVQGSQMNHIQIIQISYFISTLPYRAIKEVYVFPAQFLSPLLTFPILLIFLIFHFNLMYLFYVIQVVQNVGASSNMDGSILEHGFTLASQELRVKIFDYTPVIQTILMYYIYLLRTMNALL